jgi:hypothetical protein
MGAFRSRICPVTKQRVPPDFLCPMDLLILMRLSLLNAAHVAICRTA